ncbi:hypothetical protein B0H65DRAFT_547357 [Neurospora tetraspora]|uniref:C2H2-type domain-containing protein n=1 Tax=Neurospora tetraspora TaxID=94610 RepID=A0AAE0JHD7_9PEZI|nr:hypothetical protein B0H65DRAFT_547357 [Neurospora tetraspora]
MVRTVYPCAFCSSCYLNERDLDEHCEAETDYWSSPHRPGDEAFGCNICHLWWDDEDFCLEHMEEEDHFGFECRCCYHFSRSKDARIKHEVEKHFFCKECDRFFNNINSIKQHLNSRTHRGQEIKCPFCPNSYTTATGMTHHLESGSCRNAPSLNRDSIYKFVRSKDPSGLISKKLIGWEGTSQTTLTCTDRAWNGRQWECYLCHKGFGTSHGLNQHLNSPAHQQNLYHCPNRSNCRQDFRTLAAIINHLESEKCGAMRFEQVQRNIHGMVSGNRLIGY